MTLDEAIRHAKDVAATADCEECREQHIQLAAWLEELVDARSRRVNDIHVDAVEVVRCKDCKHAWIHPCGYIHCRRSGLLDHDMTFAPDAFCSYGERRSDNAAD